MTTFNDVTGDPLRTKAASEAYRNNYDSIFGSKKTLAQRVAEEKAAKLKTQEDSKREQ